jgi:hypothetical protein
MMVQLLVLLLLLLFYKSATAFLPEHYKTSIGVNHAPFQTTTTRQDSLAKLYSRRFISNIATNKVGTEANDDFIQQSLLINVGQDDNTGNALHVLVGNTVDCLIQSDLKRKAGKDGGSTGWTSWIDDASAYRLKCCMDIIALAKLDHTDVGIRHLSIRRHSMKSCHG